ncbi:HAD family hydrolase [Photobacterium gaetbulicola]|uniref:Putative HAD family hydrolase n=1 Tax=Photobacterium gaetbulicola Gung47 TaxID=658445 RepID=A0A0C5WEF5_9GAMM|nr:HAD family hydrolase [Photobacterium gaetbulicola]AJR05488.1 putative HAD family hydrolase [Photobacterium gaetbulicola Gung47]PST99771.1 HAD family hydrolase [Photobacterium gaetbulicola]
MNNKLPSLKQIDAIFLDAGGVLLKPDHSRIMSLADNLPITEESIDRALYAHGSVGAGLGPGDDDDAFVYEFAIAAGLTKPFTLKHMEELKDIVLFSPWIPREIDVIYDTLTKIKKEVSHIVVVSNTEEGGAKELLRDTGICQVGEGPGIEVSAIVDSGIIGVHKPDPQIYHIAADLVDTPIERCLHIGDSIRNDVNAAKKAGAIPVHFCPYGHCESSEHLHIKSLSEIVE